MRTFLFSLPAALALAGLATLTPTAPAADAGWGTIQGQIVWAGGAIPAPKKLDVTKDQEHCLGKGPILYDEYVINKANKGVRYMYVWLAPLNAGDKLPINPALANVKEKEVVIDQPRCLFEPRAVAVREGQTLLVKNSAPIPHNIKWDGIKSNGNQIIPAGKEYAIANLVAEKGPVMLSCSIHPWMTGTARVFDNPYYAITDADGKFEIKNAPAGKYKLMIWSQKGWLGGAAGKNGQMINIKTGENKPLKYELKP